MVACNPHSAGFGLVSVDWFGIQCKCRQMSTTIKPVCPDGWSAVQMGSTAVWGSRWFILGSDGNKIATLLFHPHSPKIPADNVLLEIANRYLYMDGFIPLVNTLCSTMYLTPYGMNRIDLCCDFEMSLHMWRTYTALVRGEAYVKQIRQGLQWWQQIGRHRIPHCYNLGSRESTFGWKIYWKALELHQAPDDAKKPYLTALWQQAGFEEKNVWRVEVSIHKTNALCDVMGKRLSVFEWYEQRVSLFKSLYADKFVIRRDEGHTDKRNDTVLPFLEISAYKMIMRALPREEMDDSDPERRMICKLWAEMMQPDVQANARLLGMVRETIGALVENPLNMWALTQRFGLKIADVAQALCAN